MGTLVGWLFLEEKETNTECRDTADFPTSESRFGTDSESEQSECEETEATRRDRDWQMRRKIKTERKRSPQVDWLMCSLAQAKYMVCWVS